MANLPDIDRREKLEAWLKDKPREWAQVIASRAALRVLPGAYRFFEPLSISTQLGSGDELVLTVFRANLLPAAAISRQMHDAEMFFKGAAAEASVAANTLNAADAAAYAAASAASASGAFGAANPNAYAASAALAAGRAKAAGRASIWEEVGCDALWLSNRYEQLINPPIDLGVVEHLAAAMDADLAADMAADLAGTKLWTSAQPGWVISDLAELSRRLAETDSDWTHWLDWYHARLHGRPHGLHPQLIGKLRDDFDYRVATQPDAWWARGADAVNADIARWIEEESAKVAAREDDDPDDPDADFADDLTRIYELGPEVDPDWDPYEPEDADEIAALERAALLVGALEQSRAGLPIEISGDELRLGASGTESDREAATNRLTRQLHDEIIPLARDFAELAMRLDNRHGWTGIGRAAARLADCLAEGPEAVADNIGLLWVDSVRLGSFLEQDTAILAGRSDVAEPLAAEDRRKLSDLVTVAAPYVRRYPSARELDTESRAFKASPDLVAEGRSLIADAQRTGLLNRQDGRTIEAIFDTAGHGGVQGHKAGSVAVETARNLVFKAGAVVATLYLGAVLGGAAPHSVLVSRGIETFLTSEKAIIELFKDMPDDIGIAYRILIDGMKDPAMLPSRPQPVRRREDEEKPRKR